MNKTIGIAIPTYKHHVKYLKRLMDSINNSTVKPNQVSISCSSFDKELNIDDYDFEVITTVTSDFKNTSQNRNIAANKLDTDIITLIDGDDLVHPQRTEFLLEYFSENDNPVVHNYKQTSNPDYEFLSVIYSNMDLYVDYIDTIEEKQIYPISKYRDEIIANNSISMTKETFKKHRYDENTKLHEDSYYNRKLVESGYKISYIKNELINYIKTNTPKYIK